MTTRVAQSTGKSALFFVFFFTTRFLGVPLNHYRDNDEYWRDETEAFRTKTTN